MRYRLPSACVGVVHDGTTLAMRADGSIEAPEDAAESLAAHAIVPIRETDRDAPRVGRPQHKREPR